jgi:hypothetical protein
VGRAIELRKADGTGCRLHSERRKATRQPRYFASGLLGPAQSKNPRTLRNNMHENREISSTPWSDDQGRSAMAINRTADMHVLEKSECAVVPVNQPNKGGKPSAEVGAGRARAVENIVRSHMLPTQSGNCMSRGTGGVRQAVLPPLIHSKSRMRRRARTDLCGGRSAMVLPTATVIARYSLN